MSIACRGSKAQYSMVKFKQLRLHRNNVREVLLRKPSTSPISSWTGMYLRRNLTTALAWSAYWPGYNMWVNVVRGSSIRPGNGAQMGKLRIEWSHPRPQFRHGQGCTWSRTWRRPWPGLHTCQGTTCGLMSCRARAHVPGMARRWTNLGSNVSGCVRHYARTSLLLPWWLVHLRSFYVITRSVYFFIIRLFRVWG